ncbi:MAG TPA: acyl-CoA dehydrogenase family protein, partial [Roseiarcus sp.]|nr:acyl-CoA dehydrogenase family protein [Roseiarcus sp.]
MPSYKAPVDDTLFLVTDVFDFGRYGNLPRFADAPIDVVEAVLREGGKFAEEVLQPLNHSGDEEGCTRDADGNVATPKGFRQAYKAYVEGGWVGLAGDPAYGGQGLPHFLAVALSEYTIAANLSFAMYPGLTNGAAAALWVHGEDALKRVYLPKMTTGEWTGTMNLTEPHCGTDLGLIKTKAVRQPDGSFAISGQKIFISAGEHDLADNIVHLVLARIEGAPAGTKGISLFLVPKTLVKDDGSLGARNAVVCGSLEHKMGIHANSTCVLNYDGAKGWLVGEENRGLNAMFVMMNAARLGVAVHGLSLSDVAYQNAAAYAKDRLQGRSLTGAKELGKPADPIIVHPDVRRMLLEIRAFNEAARALMLWVALSEDEALESPDPAAKRAADDRIGLLTPVIKGVFTDIGFANAVKAQQVLGGHGYIAEWGMEQFVRDARITMIYEGANGIQALDLVGRK